MFPLEDKIFVAHLKNPAHKQKHLCSLFIFTGLLFLDVEEVEVDTKVVILTDSQTNMLEDKQVNELTYIHIDKKTIN